MNELLIPRLHANVTSIQMTLFPFRFPSENVSGRIAGASTSYSNVIWPFNRGKRTARNCPRVIQERSTVAVKLGFCPTDGQSVTLEENSLWNVVTGEKIHELGQEWRPLGRPVEKIRKAALSPDGKSVVYSVRDIRLKTDRRLSSIRPGRSRGGIYLESLDVTD